MKLRFLLLIFISAVSSLIQAQEGRFTTADYVSYYHKLSYEYLKLADYFANKAIEAYYEPDVDSDHIKELNKLRYQYQLLALGLDPHNATAYNELVNTASVETAIDFELITDTIHGKTIIEHIAQKTEVLCKDKNHIACAHAQKTHTAFKEYVKNIFEELKKYDNNQ
jgi:hypothetical protein